MTKEDKTILFQDLCARLPYHPRVKVWLKAGDTEEGLLDLEHNYGDVLRDFFYGDEIKCLMPYLRPMSSMTEEETDTGLIDKTTLKGLNAEVEYNPDTERIQTAEYVISNDIRFGESTDEYPPIDHVDMYKTIDWLNKHHFDYRGLIQKGLALEAPEGMYDIKVDEV